MIQNQTVAPLCVSKPAAPCPVPPSKFSVELMRMLSQLVMLR